MLQINNQTPYETERAILLDKTGQELWVVIVKGTFEIKNGKAVLAEKQEPICLADEYYGKPSISSQRYESDITFFKPTTDIVLNGHAYSPKGKPIKKMDISLKVGPVSKILRVFGDRIWKKSLIGGLNISDIIPFVKMPLIYERAFGGSDTTHKNPKKHDFEKRNPVGVGFAVEKENLIDKPLPNLEDPKDRISSWKDRPKPMGFGFISKQWEPRRNYAGTYDQKWQEERLPLWPLDFDERFNQAATPDLITPKYLVGGEAVELRNMTPGGLLSFQLPRMALTFQTRLEGKNVEHRAKLDTIILEPDFPRVIMVWRTSIPCHRKKFELELTTVREKKVVSLGK